MKRTTAMTVFVAILSFANSMSAQLIGPFVGNNYNYVQPGMPNYGIAQGSIFIIAGAPMPLSQSTASQSVPLQTTLAGVTVAVKVGNVTTQAVPYYVSPSQITAILPSKTPVGAATITVTSGGMSVSGSTTVVPSAFGMATVSTPAGPAGPWSAALAQDDSEGGQLLSQANAANPGEYLTLWGSGLGPVSGYRRRERHGHLPWPVDLSGRRSNQRHCSAGSVGLQRVRGCDRGRRGEQFRDDPGSRQRADLLRSGIDPAHNRRVPDPGGARQREYRSDLSHYDNDRKSGDGRGHQRFGLCDVSEICRSTVRVQQFPPSAVDRELRY